jgi:hypothetical protein
MMKNAYRLLILSPELPLAYLSHRKDEQWCWKLWHALLFEIPQHPQMVQSTFLPLLEAAQKGLLPTYLRPEAEEMDIFIGKLLVVVLGDSAAGTQLRLVRQVIQTPSEFFSVYEI